MHHSCLKETSSNKCVFNTTHIAQLKDEEYHVEDIIGFVNANMAESGGLCVTRE
jgi:hypothetical protein